MENNVKSALFQDPKTQHPIYNLELPFNDYIQECRQIIANTRVDLHHNAEKIISANAPFELRPTKIKAGVLLIHGLLDSPFIMRDIGQNLYEKGFLTRAILLPGHGTVPGDLLSIDYKTWLQALRYGIASLKKEVDHIYLVGFSTGASLALHHVLHGAKITGVVMIAPAIKIRSTFDFSSNWYQIISWAWERAKWLNVDKENDYAKYQSMCFNAAYQVYKLTRVIKSLSKNRQTTCPLFFVLSKSDTTVSTRASMKYFQQYPQPNNRVLLYTRENDAYPNVPNVMLRNSIFPDMHINSISHIGLPVSPNNDHYGIQGDYINASHTTEQNNTVYGAFSKLDNMIYRFLYENKLTTIQRKRLTFNPDFDFLLSEIEKFMTF